MFKLTYILLLFLCSQFLNSQEIREVWRKSDVHNVDYIYHDIATNLLYVLDRTNNGTVWMLNPETGEFVDSIHTSMISNYMTLSPNKKLLLLSSDKGLTVIYDIEKKEVLSNFPSSGHAGFIDDNTILYYAPNSNGLPNDRGINKCDIYNNNIENLWNNLPYMGGHMNPNRWATINIESCFSSDGKYALISIWSYSEGEDLILFDVESRTELKTYNGAQFPMFNPNGREFILRMYKADYFSLFKLNDFYNSYKTFIPSNEYRKFINDGSGIILYGNYNPYFEFGENYDIRRQLNFKLDPVLDYDINDKSIYERDLNSVRKLDIREYLGIIQPSIKGSNSNFETHYDSISNFIIIKNIGSSAERVDINLYSIVGNLILSKKNVLINNTETINLSENATGIYILQIKNNNTNLSFKIIKN